MSRLEYQIHVSGEGQIRRVARGIERELSAHAARVNRIASRAGLPGRTRHGAVGTAASIGGGPYRTAQRQAKEAGRTHGRVMREMATGWRELAKVGATAARKQYREQVSAMKRAEREHQASLRRQQMATQAARRSMLRGVAVGAGRGVRNVAALGGGAAGILGGMAFAGALSSEVRLDNSIAQLTNQAYRADGSRGSRDQIFRNIKDTVVREGSGGEGAEAVTGGLRKFVALTGDLQTGLGITPMATRVATATGANTEDVFSTAGETMLALQNRGVKGAEAIKQVNEALRILAGQGKEGSIEFADLSAVMGKLGASTARFEGSVPDLIATMGAFAQLSKRGAATGAEEATTAILRMSDDIVQNAKRFEKVGVDVFRYDTIDGKKTRVGVKDPVAIISEAFKKTRGDVQETSKLFGIRGAKSADALFNMARSMGDGDIGKGLKAMETEVNKFRNAKLSDKELKESAQFQRDRPGMRLKAAQENFNREVGKALIPALQQLTPEVVKLVPKLAQFAKMLAKFIGWFSENPLTGIGSIVALSVSKEIAGAGIGKAIEKAISGSAGAGGGLGKLGGKTSFGGALGAAGIGLSVGTITAATIYAGGIALAESTMNDTNTSSRRINEAMQKGSREQVQTEVDKAKKRLSETETTTRAIEGIMDMPLILPNLLRLAGADEAADKISIGAGVVRGGAGGLGADMQLQKDMIAKGEKFLSQDAKAAGNELVTASKTAAENIKNAKPAANGRNDSILNAPGG